MPNNERTDWYKSVKLMTNNSLDWPKPPMYTCKGYIDVLDPHKAFNPIVLTREFFLPFVPFVDLKLVNFSKTNGLTISIKQTWFDFSATQFVCVFECIFVNTDDLSFSSYIKKNFDSFWFESIPINHRSE